MQNRAPGIFREPGRHAPRAGLPAWSIEAARDRDLIGVPYTEIANRLEYVDYQMAYPERSRRAEERVRQGRQLLSELDAWPWALADSGRLPGERWVAETFIRPLSFWIRDAALEVVGDALRVIELAGDADVDVSAMSGRAWDAARRAYRDALGLDVIR